MQWIGRFPPDEEILGTAVPDPDARRAEEEGSAAPEEPAPEPGDDRAGSRVPPRGSRADRGA
jgi:hypothetical protein